MMEMTATTIKDEYVTIRIWLCDVNDSITILYWVSVIYEAGVVF
jgi:hypothetical protein